MPINKLKPDQRRVEASLPPDEHAVIVALGKKLGLSRPQTIDAIVQHANKHRLLDALALQDKPDVVRMDSACHVETDAIFQTMSSQFKHSGSKSKVLSASLTISRNCIDTLIEDHKEFSFDGQFYSIDKLKSMEWGTMLKTLWHMAFTAAMHGKQYRNFSHLVHKCTIEGDPDTEIRLVVAHYLFSQYSPK
jgi:hypothetical protein